MAGPSSEHTNGSHGEAPVILQECLEGDLDAMLAARRPCHYAIANGHHVLWVPKHVPCSFEPSTGRLVVEVGHNCRWLAPLHNPRSPLLSVPVGPAVRIASSRRWVPELRFPRKEPWRRAQVLELEFSKVDKSECCPLARVRIYSEELRSLREALHLMVQRGNSGGNDADKKGGDENGDSATGGPGMAPIAESSGRESSPVPSQHSSPVPPATPAKMGESPPTGCACFPGLLRRHSSLHTEVAVPPRGVLHVDPHAATSSAHTAESVGPETPRQEGRGAAAQPQQPANSAAHRDIEHFFGGSSRGRDAQSQLAGSARGAARIGDQGAEAIGAPEPALRRGSGSGTLSSVDEATDSFTAAAAGVDSAAELAARDRRPGSGDSVSSVAGPRKAFQPGGTKILAWGDSAQESPLSTTTVPSAATSQRGDYIQGSPHSTTAGPSTATSSQRGSGDSGTQKVFFGLEGATPAYAGGKVLARPEFGSGSTTAASSRRPSGEVSGDGIWSSKGSSGGSNEALVERATNFKRSLEAAQHAFYRDISLDAADAAAGIKIIPRAAAAATGVPAGRMATPVPPVGANNPRGDPEGNSVAIDAAVAKSAVAEEQGPGGAATAVSTGPAAAAAAAAARFSAGQLAAAEPAAAVARRPERRRRADGRSLPELLLQTAQAVRSCPEFTDQRRQAPENPAGRQATTRAGHDKADLMSGGLKVTQSDGSLTRYGSSDMPGLEIWDTARGPAGQYWDVPRPARSLEAGTRFVLQPGRGNASDRVPIGLRAPQEPIPLAVRQQASLITQSKRSCGEVWAPGYESSPEGSSSEGEQQAAPAAKRLAPTGQRSEETTVLEAAAKMAAAAAQPARGAAARPAVADSPFRPQPPKQATAGGNAPASIAPPSQATSRLRPKRLNFQSPPARQQGGPLSPDLATPHEPELATPSPATPHTAQREASGGDAPGQPGPSTASTQFHSPPASPLPENDSAKEAAEQQPLTETSAAQGSEWLASSPFHQASLSQAGDMDRNAASSSGASKGTLSGTVQEAVSDDAVSSLATPRKAGDLSSEGSAEVWQSSGLYASSNNEAGSSAFQATSRSGGAKSAAGVDDTAEQLVAVKLRVAKPRQRQTGFVAAAIAALGLSSPVVQRSPSQENPVSLSVTPVPSPAAVKQKLALSPDQFDMSWFTGRLSSAAADEGANASALGGDKVASAAARLLTADPTAFVAPAAAAAASTAEEGDAEAPSPPAPGKIRAAPVSPTPELGEGSSADESSPANAATAQHAAEEAGESAGSADATPRNEGGSGGGAAEKLAAECNGKAAALPGAASEEAASPKQAVQGQKRAVPDLGSETEGSPRPPGLLYKPELRSVAERVKYIERRSHSRTLDSPRAPHGVPSPRIGAEAGGSHAARANTSIQAYFY